MSLSSRIILVTGASSGIGRAVTEAMRAAGALVLATGRRGQANLDQYHPADLGKSTDRESLVRWVETRTDHLDVVVHNAGVLGTPATALDAYDEGTWRQVLEANLTAVHLLHQRLTGLLAASARPTVIAVSSGVGRAGRAGWGAYAVSKHGLEGWVQVLADEWRSRGRVYSVNPGGTATPMRAAAMPTEDPSDLPSPVDVVPIFLRLAHEYCPEPSGARFDARDWIGQEPWNGLRVEAPPGRVAPNEQGEAT